ncbi:hypothetical protein ES703_26818 [subsurface metagenome]
MSDGSLTRFALLLLLASVLSAALALTLFHPTDPLRVPTYGTSLWEAH